MMRQRVHVLTNIASYHQVDLFDRIEQEQRVDLFVSYLRPITPGRQWESLPQPKHGHAFLKAGFNKGLLYVNPEILAHLRRVPADVTVITQYAGLSLQVAMYLALLRGKRWVFWSERPGVELFEVTSGIPEFVLPLARRLAMAPVRRASAVWAVGETARVEYERLLGRPCASFPYFSDLSRFGRRGAGYCADGRVRFLYAGRYSHRKGFDTLCEAFGALARNAAVPAGSWKLTVCGGGDLRLLLDSPPAREANIEDRGFLQLAEMPAIMREHDVFVFPSRYDGWGMVVPEALAAGMPVISTDKVGSAADIGKRPFLKIVPAGDPGRLAEVLAEIHSERPSIGTLGAQAASTSARYDVARGAGEFAELIGSILGTGE